MARNQPDRSSGRAQLSLLARSLETRSSSNLRPLRSAGLDNNLRRTKGRKGHLSLVPPHRTRGPKGRLYLDQRWGRTTSNSNSRGSSNSKPVVRCSEVPSGNRNSSSNRPIAYLVSPPANSNNSNRPVCLGDSSSNKNRCLARGRGLHRSSVTRLRTSLAKVRIHSARVSNHKQRSRRYLGPRRGRSQEVHYGGSQLRNNREWTSLCFLATNSINLLCVDKCMSELLTVSQPSR